LLKSKQTEGNVLSIHLDEIRANTDQTEIFSMIKALPSGTGEEELSMEQVVGLADNQLSSFHAMC
jgi:hypothetical protein